ncbi:MAG: CdaR family protein [Myxococcota bacterium]|nr:CdaR family protein [Myxococcota bacterium]
MRRRISSFRPLLLVSAFLIASLLWALSQGQANIEQVLTVPVELRGVPESLVITERKADELSIHVRGSAAALRNIEKDQLSFPIDISSSKRGVTTINVPNPPVSLPRGVSTTQLAPSQITLRLDAKARKPVTVHPDLEGEPAEGFRLKDLRVVPSRVWLAGARSQVLKLDEVVTEPIVLTGLAESEEREVRLYLGGGSVWKEDEEPVRIVIEIEAIEPDETLEVDGPGETG